VDVGDGRIGLERRTRIEEQAGVPTIGTISRPTVQNLDELNDLVDEVQVRLRVRRARTLVQSHLL
jgi:hypothetical protein